MLVAARALARYGGGFVVVAEGAVQAIFPLPVAGLLRSKAPTSSGASSPRSITRAGCWDVPLQAPFGSLSFLGVPVIPDLRITTKGLFDVNEQTLLTL